MTPHKPPSIFRQLMAAILGIAFFFVVIFWPAGIIGWVEGWCYFGIVSATLLLNFIYLHRVNPDVIEHRLRMGKGTKRWDKIWLAFFTLVFLALYVMAGFDAVRYEWSTMPLWLWPLGLVFWLLGNILFTWSMGVNPFFEKTVRIQTERGHRVIDTGPYRFIRHPGYLGFFGWALSVPLLLGSWWAFLPALLCIVTLITRTALEDKTLQQELAGYREYAVRVRYRLIPRIW